MTRPTRTPDQQPVIRASSGTDFAHPYVTVDVALVTVADGRLCVLLHRRPEPPAKRKWALPGGFVDVDESLDAAAERILGEKAGLTGVFLEQLYTFGSPDRDPRTRIITIAYYALVAHERISASFDARPNTSLARIVVPWSGEKGGPVDVASESGESIPLAFDHDDILGVVVKRLRGKLNYAPIGFQLLPRHFTLRTLQTVHETILGTALNKDSFRRRMLASGQLVPTKKHEKQVGHRPAELYRFLDKSAV
jgi:8-oxo-dGTP diphosphatase